MISVDKATKVYNLVKHFEALQADNINYAEMLGVPDGVNELGFAQDVGFFVDSTTLSPEFIVKHYQWLRERFAVCLTVPRYSHKDRKKMAAKRDEFAVVARDILGLAETPRIYAYNTLGMDDEEFCTFFWPLPKVFI